jgi:hypothetical protein
MYPEVAYILNRLSIDDFLNYLTLYEELQDLLDISKLFTGNLSSCN